MRCGVMPRNPSGGGARWWATADSFRSSIFRIALLNLLQLLQAARHANCRRHRRVPKTGLPVGDADLADIDVAVRIQRHAVRGEKLAGFQARAVLATEPCDALAF